MDFCLEFLYFPILFIKNILFAVLFANETNPKFREKFSHFRFIAAIKAIFAAKSATSRTGMDQIPRFCRAKMHASVQNHICNKTGPVKAEACIRSLSRFGNFQPQPAAF